MYTIGLTGGIASGKSTVSAILAKLGATIIDTDEIARRVVGREEPAWRAIVAHFSSAILLPDGNIDRKILGEKIFRDPVARQSLEKIIHPFIEKQVEESVAQARLAGKEIVVLDVPLLFEVGWQNMVDGIWVVYVEEKVQLARLMARNGFSHQQAMERIDAQMSLAEKVKQADVIIDNNADVEQARKQVVLAWEVLWKSLVSM